MTVHHRIMNGEGGCDGCLAHRCPLAALRGRGHRHALAGYERGERLPAPDRGALRLSVVLGGLIALCVGLADGRRQIVELEGSGDVLCAIEGRDRFDSAVWAEALTHTPVCEVDFALEDTREPALMHCLFELTHRKLAGAAGRAVTLGRLDAGERICGFLADLARRIGRQAPDGWHLNLPLSREDMADYLGLNAETVSRILGRTRKAGLLRFVTRTDLVLPDLEALEARAAVPAFLARRHLDARGGTRP